MKPSAITQSGPEADGRRQRLLPALAVLGLLATLTACATAVRNEDAAQIDRMLAARGAPSLGWENNGAADPKVIQSWLGQPMTIDLAVRMAMMKSPRLQRELGDLGLARADVLEAVQIANPKISATRFASENGPGAQTTYGVAMPLVDLLVLPLRARLGRQEYERAKLQIASAILDVDLDVEGAWYRAVAAQQVADMRAAVATSLEASADLARRYFDAGNISELQLSREQAAASQARIGAARAAIEARVTRLALDNMIGLRGDETDWRPSAVLSLPVDREDTVPELRNIAAGNLSLLAARRGVDISADAAAITRRLRLLGATAIGYGGEREVDRSRIDGPTIDLEIPIFNQGQARVARAEGRLKLARAQLSDIELDIGNAIDPAAERVRALSDIVAIHQAFLVPQRQNIVARSQEEQNFMLIGIFEVIQAKTQEYDAYQSYLESVRDYWVARVDLMRLVGSRLPSESRVTGATRGVGDFLTSPPAAAMESPMRQQGAGGAMPGGVMPDASPQSHAEPGKIDAPAAIAPTAPPAGSTPPHREPSNAPPSSFRGAQSGGFS